MSHKHAAPPRFALHPQLASDTHPVAHLPLCDLLLMDDANHPWLILVPRLPDAVEIIDLSEDEQAELMREISLASRALKTAFKPDKINVAALGNMVPQLHVHVIARFKGDIAWPRPAWGMADALPYSAETLVERIQRLRAVLGN
ncbi:HIT family protein [Lysobacter olei]